MRLEATPLDGVFVVEPRVHRDGRGFFLEVFHSAKLAALGLSIDVVQDNHSSSCRDTLRGLHLQTLEPQGKLVRCIEGEIYDVAVDLRRGSPRFGEWFATTLSAGNFRMLWIPPGFAHGFCVTSDRAQVEYKCTTHYRPEADLAIRWDDPALGIPWPVAAPLLSERDAAAPVLAEVIDRLVAYAP